MYLTIEERERSVHNVLTVFNSVHERYLVLEVGLDDLDLTEILLAESLSDGIDF